VNGRVEIRDIGLENERRATMGFDICFNVSAAHATVTEYRRRQLRQK
jgi:hypothetical protein